MSKNRNSALVGIHSLLTDSPFSGDPSYYIENYLRSQMSVSIEQLSRLSTNQSVIDRLPFYRKLLVILWLNK